jgi:hypothetical protein
LIVGAGVVDDGTNSLLTGDDVGDEVSWNGDGTGSGVGLDVIVQITGFAGVGALLDEPNVLL